MNNNQLKKKQQKIKRNKNLISAIQHLIAKVGINVAKQKEIYIFFK